MCFFEREQKVKQVPRHEDAVSYEHITREFGEGFLFSPASMKAGERDIEEYLRGKRQDIDAWHYGTRVAVFESAVYRKIVRLSLRIPTFDSSDREYDSWHDLYLLQEHGGKIRAVYCTGGYRVAKVEGYAEVYQYPEDLKIFFDE